MPRLPPRRRLAWAGWPGSGNALGLSVSCSDALGTRWGILGMPWNILGRSRTLGKRFGTSQDALGPAAEALTRCEHALGHSGDIRWHSGESVGALRKHWGRSGMLWDVLRCCRNAREPAGIALGMPSDVLETNPNLLKLFWVSHGLSEMLRGRFK